MKKVLKCAECGLSQLKQKCCSRIYAKATLETDTDELISLVLFYDNLQALYQLNRKGNPKPSELTDEEIEEHILEAEALLIYFFCVK